MKKSSVRSIIEIAVTTVLTGLLVYAAYSLWYIFYGTDSSVDVHLYTTLSGLALGWSMYMFMQSVLPFTGLAGKIIAFLAGNGLFHGLIWGLNAKINTTGNDNEIVVVKTFAFTFAATAILLLVSFIFKARKSFKPLHTILAIVYFAVSCGGFYCINKENIRAIEYKKGTDFGTLSAQEAQITEAEQKLSTKWVQENLLSDDSSYPFTFTLDGEKFNPDEWTKQLSEAEEAVYQGGKTCYLTFTHEEKPLEVTVEATVFEENATCQWTVYLKNTGSENSGVITDFYALDSSFVTGDAKIYYSIGSDTQRGDFSLVEKKLGSKVRTFSGNEGKPTEKFLPYFNVNGKDAGIVFGIGWTGQWQAEFSQSEGNTAVTVKQQNFEAYLLPDEEVRSPLVSVSFYDNDNALKGFNLFRSWVVDSVYPENITKNYYTVMEVAGPTSTRTADEIIAILDGIDSSVYDEIDCFWMDAGWYNYNEGWYDGVGNWSTPDASRYDNGIAELSGYAKERGVGHVLWYEPERVYPGTEFHTVGSQHDGWLIYGGSDNIMWNLANEDAFKYYCETLLASLKKNGVTVYRQDFNFAPLEYWQNADNELYGGRNGICENHYVTNLYRFLDYLCENIDGLIIDNCASGGKRLDLEMTYRSIPFWRSDYNCAIHYDLFNATQSHTYGLSFWLPISGTALNQTSEYSVRSAIIPLFLMDIYAWSNELYDLYEDQRALMTGNYYPLEFGSYDENKMHAMQFAAEDGLSGTALIYKRAKVSSDEYTVKLNGLFEEKTYNVYDIDKPETVYTLTGAELMDDGIKLSLPKGEKAIILMYNAD